MRVLLGDGPMARQEAETALTMHRQIQDWVGEAGGLRILAVARSHHERVDGTGLPDALAKGYIPLAARIVCVADSFDAITTNRPYQRASTYTEAADELRRCTGRQFDASCVSALTRALSRASNDAERGFRTQKPAMA